MTSLSKHRKTRRPFPDSPFSATPSQSGRAVLPPHSLVPRQFQTPGTARQHSPCVMAASAFLTPSVIHSGAAGSRTISRRKGWTSTAMLAPWGNSYLATLPLRILGWSGRWWYRLTSPVRQEKIGTSSVGTIRAARPKPRRSSSESVSTER